ncbi:MAG: hypothetical protein GY697_03155 [Desulfobacterales bacterium]|nr:hypothetical protein [Desulfobacterales bacterium]
MGTVDIDYRFKLPDKSEKSFKLRLDPSTAELVRSPSIDLPDWTRLGFHQCPNCPYETAAVAHCPASVCIMEVVQCFNGLISYDEIEVEIITSERRLSQKTSAQQGISSLMGLLIAASGCPRSAYFKPMARFHLPLSNPDETMYRATTMYLLAQYFRKQANQDYDMDLEGLAEIYQNMQIINYALADRIRAASETDSSVNALILLDMHAKTLTYVIEEYLDSLKKMFSAYL